MSIAIHHGSPGSYKTSGATQDDFIPAAKQGRVVITNVRGLNDESLIRKYVKGNFNFKTFKFNSIPDTFKIINIDTSTSEGKMKMALWFHWAPKNAFIFIDEINTIYPSTLSTRDLTQFDYPNGIDAAKYDDRPPNVVQAFEMHRHYNWDICLTTPHIRKVHTFIRACSEGAYRHKNQAMVGLKGFYQQIFHSADDDGKAKSNQLLLQQRRIKKHVFKLYKSTTTDQVRDTQAGKNIFLSPQVLAFVFIFGSLGYYLYSSDAPRAFRSSENISTLDTVNSAPDKNANHNNTIDTNNQVLTSVAPDVNQKAIELPKKKPDFLIDYDVYYTGSIRKNLDIQHQFQLVKNNKTITITDKWLIALGYTFKRYGQCLMEVTINKTPRIITCPLHDDSSDNSSIPDNFSF